MHRLAILILCFVLFSICECDKTYVYDYFPLDHQKKQIPFSEVSTRYLEPKNALLPFKTIEEIEEPIDLLRGRFHGFVKLLTMNRANVYGVSRAIANVIHYVEGGAFIRMFNSRAAFRRNKFTDVLIWWRYFYLCLTTYNFRKHYGPCTDGFMIRGNKSYMSLLDWDPERDIPLLPLGQDMLLILFNLGLCQNFHHTMPFLCPAPCLGRLRSGATIEGQLPSEDGNPCELQSKTRTAICLTRRTWSVYIYQMFSELVNPTTWYRLPGENFLKWLTDESGYVCDCEERYHWVDTSMRCERTKEWVNRCNLGNGTRIGPCDRNGTHQCTTDQYTGAVYCECNQGYYGARCKNRLDACTMKLVTYLYKDPITGKTTRKTATGMEMCNTNMSGLSVPQPSSEFANDEDFRSVCIPSLGTLGYRCKCKEPFMEDPTHPMPNCLKRIGPCDDKLCLHGTCVATSGPNATSICVCNPGYDGEMCEYRAEHWSVWSECLPICGHNRTRTRRRSTTLRDPTPWEPHFDELAGIPTRMSDREMKSLPGVLIQTETCPPRTGSQCPFSPSSPNYQTMAQTDPGLLELQAYLSLAISVLLLLIGISACIARMTRSYKAA
ncbi:hypothetical protein CSKR_105622 [Clonorchis sinensis]|uniref:Uncharacterized protein n=2 Tax=Clonorchis sinensis TaxID=79923 RepID=A0A8T1MQ13_CLOSI|nr:hypothetical protein CSKR_105622 [Clonorchis sinensis]GAA49057.1 acidic fibroblast growth factor intracellular binding protein [Clonorchis sinensis]